MSRSIICFTLCLMWSIFCFTQHSIEGRVLDENKEPLSHATVALLHPTDSTLLFFGISNAKGEYLVRNIAEDTYLMQFSYVGMQSIYQIVNIPPKKGADLGDQILKPTLMEEVVVEAELIPIRFKNDTLEYDTKAFKTRPGASTEELLEKLPGIEVDQEGNIKAEGEEVTKVLVDGKEFFDKDPKVATKNLPALAVKKVQVIDRQSEEAQFTGVDDGIREKTINLELKEDHKKGYFGDVTAGVGAGAVYKAEGKVYRFSKKTQMALMGMANNLNEFGFTHKGNNQFGQSARGINASYGGGFNLSFNPSRENRYFINYLGNRLKNDLQEETFTQNFVTDGVYEQRQTLDQSETSRPHKLNYGIRHNFNKQNRLILNGALNIAASDQISENFTRSAFEKKRVNQLNNTTNNDNEQLNFNTEATYISKLNGESTQIKTQASASYSDQTSQLEWINNTRFFDPPSMAVVEQYRNNHTDRLNLEVSPSILQKLGKKWSVNLGAGIGLKENNLKRSEGVLNGADEFVDFAIPSFLTRETYVQPELSFNHATNQSQLNFSFKAFANSFDKVLAGGSVDKPSYFYWLPSFSYRNEYRTGRRVNMRYTTEVNMPSVSQLYPVVDSINQLAIYRGNIDLKPEYRHNLSLGWSMFDQFSFTSLFTRLSGSFTKDDIRWSQRLNRDLVKVNTPLNVGNNHSVSSYVYFSTPIRSLGLNLNITSNENWNRGIVFINNEKNVNTNFTHSLGLAFENRKNEKLSARLSASFSLTNSTFSVAESQNNVYFNTSYLADLRYTPNKKWNIEARANIVNYDARTFDEAVSVPLITAGISYFFMKNEMASLTLSGFDLLNKYVGFRRISELNYLQQQEWNTIGQYAMLSFRWRFR